MQIPTKKLKNGFEMPVLWIGTWKMWWEVMRDMDNDDARDIRALQYAISQWLTCIDSAEMYAYGYSETLLGQAIRNTQREELFLSSKVNGNKCDYDEIKDACMKSLERLWVEYLDLYYIHWKDENFSPKNAMRALNELVDEWYIRYIGVSNFSAESLKEAQKHSQYPIVANQVHFNLIYREPEAVGLLEYCQKNDIMLVAWRPFEYWEFSTPEAQELLDDMSEKYKKTHFQIALNWIISQKNVVTLFMSKNPQNIDENLWALWWEMWGKDIHDLRKNFPWQQDTSNVVPLA